MHHVRKSLYNVVFTASAAIFITSCATTPEPEEPVVQAVEETQPIQTDTEGRQIDQQLSAIEALIKQHQIEEAQIILNGLVFDDLTTEQKTRYVLAKANSALILGDGQEALRWFSGEYVFLFDGLPFEQQIAIGLKRAEAHEFSGNPLAAARERIFIAPVLEGEQAQLNKDQIWFDLQLVPEAELRALAENESSPDLNGWIELSLISLTQSEDLYRLLASVENWQKRRRSHPAATDLPGSLKMLRELANTQPTHIGVILPLSGRLEKVSNAVRNGLLSSWYQAKQAGQETPEITFYDSAATEDIQNLYRQAITNGAELIIGPLEKAKVNRLAQLDTLEVPVLALNYMDASEAAPDRFYQFGLAPEDEAIQIADDIWQQGVRSVLVIAPNSNQGIRVSDAFIRHWQLKGGTITSKALFNRPDQYLGAVKNALNIQLSERRHQILAGKLDSDIEFEYRRRQDVDMVFMHAFPAQARQLKPILNYQRAIDLPIVATSYIYSGKTDTDRDKDLEGIRLVDMPWRLSPSSQRSRVASAFPDSLENYSNLVALGIDAFRLFPRLPQLSAYSDVRVQGVTGAMSMNESGQINRTLDWAIVENGIVRRRPLNPTPQDYF